MKCYVKAHTHMCNKFDFIQLVKRQKYPFEGSTIKGKKISGCYKERVEYGIQELKDINMITFDWQNHVRMHNLLRDMGREIIRQESPKEPGERSRLWNDNESYDVLMEKTGEREIEGIVLQAGNIPSINLFELETDAFAKMGRLRILILSKVQINGKYQSFPKKLRWLRWYRFPLEHIPNDFRLDKLVVLQMSKSNLKQVWEIPKVRLPQLKILDLSYSQYLTETPDFSLIPELERLILSDCESLVNVHESITNLKKLVYFDMRNCKRIKNLPDIGKIESLKVFIADNTPMNGCISKSFPNSNHLPRFLVDLSLINCNLSDEDFRPLGFCSNLSLLTDLNLCLNQFSRLPDFIRSLTGLDRLDISSCLKLKTVERLPDIRSSLTLNYCSSLEKVTFKSDSCKPERVHYHYTKIVEFEYWFKVYPLESIDEEMIRLFGLENYLESLRDIRINIYSSISRERKSVPIQGIMEHGIFNIFLPRNKFPKCFSPLLPPPPIKNLQGLNISIVYAVNINHGHRLKIEVKNITKHLTWIYEPTFFGYPDDEQDKEMIWLSNWNFGNHELQVGDVVVVSLWVDNVFFKIKVNLKECRVHTMYNADTSTSNRGGGLIYKNRQEFYMIKDYPRTYFMRYAPFLDAARADFPDQIQTRYRIAKDVFGINKVMTSCEGEKVVDVDYDYEDGFDEDENDSKDEYDYDSEDEYDYDCEGKYVYDYDCEDEDEDDCEDGFDAGHQSEDEDEDEDASSSSSSEAVKLDLTLGL